MKSDPFDSAAWKAFDLLEPGEARSFDEALRHDPLLRGAHRDIERIAAAVAATMAPPVDPRPEQFERLQLQLGLIQAPPTFRRHAIAGWTAAALLAGWLVLHATGVVGKARDVAEPPSRSNPTDPPGETQVAPNDHDAARAKAESTRLNQEIHALRQALEKAQSRERALFETPAGAAQPVVMVLTPPGVAAEDPAAKADGHSPLATLLGDALTVLTSANLESLDPPPELPALPDYAVAIPIYDPARDAGILVINNLPPAADGETYNLWVTTQAAGQPVHVGGIPASSASGAEALDFNLGTTMIPTGFLLTRDPLDAPAPPAETNIVLRGPQAAAPPRRDDGR